MTVLVEGAGVPLAVTERGQGRAVLLVHGIGGDAEALAPLAAQLADRARVLAYDRRGYGASGAPEPYGATTVNEQAEDAAAILTACDAAPAIVFGDGFGALVALDLLVRRADTVRGARLADPPRVGVPPHPAAVRVRAGGHRGALGGAAATGGGTTRGRPGAGGRALVRARGSACASRGVRRSGGPDELAGQPRRAARDRRAGGGAHQR